MIDCHKELLEARVVFQVRVAEHQKSGERGR